ncbi:MAG TPA: serine hydrolase domain-containing protein [Caulobacteraceae bacterium]|jgi:CubicO group peptidase (beta-lactamase class C family)
MALVAMAGGAAAAKTPPSQTLAPAAMAAIDAAAAKTLARSPGMAIEVMRGGRVLFSKAYGMADLEHAAPARTDTVFRIASTTKPFTVAAVLQLVQEGKVSLDDRLSKYVPELPQAEKVTLYQLLTHTSGIPDYAEDPAGAATKAVRRSPAEMVAWIGRLEPRFQFEPGTAWRYSNSNYWLLGVVVERVRGAPLAQVYRERLFKPAGLTHTAFDEPADIVPHRARGYRWSKEAGGFVNADAISFTMPGPAGGLRSTAHELAAWSQALMHGRVIGPQMLKQMTAPGRLADGRPDRWGMPKEWREGMQADYGMGLFIDAREGVRRVHHSGDVDGFHSWMAYYPDFDASIVILMNSESADAPEQAVQAAVLNSLKPRAP